MTCSRPAYDTDLTDEQYARIEPLLPPRKSGTPKGGRPPRPWREILNAILYITRTGAAWRHMPHDLVHWKTAYHYFRLFCIDGTWERMHGELRTKVRLAAGREDSPSAAIIDSQSTKTTEKGAKIADTMRARRSKAPSATSLSTPSGSCSP